MDIGGEELLETHVLAAERLARAELLDDSLLRVAGAKGKRLVQALVAISNALSHQQALNRELSRITMRVSQGLTTNDVLNELYEQFRPLVPYDRLGLALVDADKNLVRSVFCRSDDVPIALRVGYSARLEGSSLAEILRTSTPRVLNDLLAYAKKHPASRSTRLILSEGIRSSLTCPLVVAGRPVGFLFFSSRTANTYSHAHTGVFMQLAGLVSYIVDRSVLIERLFSTNEKLERSNARLSILASEDSLTGLPNRGHFDRCLSAEWRRAKRHNQSIALILADVDRFKEFNDAYGHMAGDMCLRQVADALRQFARRGGELAARFGGEEFAVLLPGHDLDEATAVAEHQRAAVAGLTLQGDGGAQLRPVTISMGVAALRPSRGSQYLDLVRQADRALYRAKNEGRNRVEGTVEQPDSEGAMTTRDRTSG